MTTNDRDVMAAVDPKEWAASPWRTNMPCSREDVLDLINEQLPGEYNREMRGRILASVERFKGPEADVGAFSVECWNTWQAHVVEQVALRTRIPLVGVLAAS